MARQKSKAQEEAAEMQEKALPLEWHFPETLVSRYATNMTIQYTGQEYILSFFEARPPLIIGAPEVVREALERVEAVRAECFARIIVSKDRMPNFVSVLKENLDRSQPPLALKAEQD